jgi:hypothetical protein
MIPEQLETWKKIPEFDDYEASTLGNFRNGKTKRILRLYVVNDYLRINLRKESKQTVSCRAHRLVAKTFFENPENKPSVDHIDGNKKNNAVSNLRWATHSENISYFNTHHKRKIRPLKFENNDSVILFSSINQACIHFGKAKGTIFGAYRTSLAKDNYKWNGYRITEATDDEILAIESSTSSSSS